MAVLVRVKPSGSQDVVSYQIYMKPHVENQVITKDNASMALTVPLSGPRPDSQEHLLE